MTQEEPEKAGGPGKKDLLSYTVENLQTHSEARRSFP
jgi:hypothetical protein